MDAELEYNLTLLEGDLDDPAQVTSSGDAWRCLCLDTLVPSREVEDALAIYDAVQQMELEHAIEAYQTMAAEWHTFDTAGCQVAPRAFVRATVGTVTVVPSTPRPLIAHTVAKLRIAGSRYREEPANLQYE